MAVRIWADVTLNDKGLALLEKNAPHIAQRVGSEVSAFVVKYAKARSRVDTGKMRKGWTRRKIGSRQEGASWRVYNSVPYTVYNEFGTRNMGAQPMLRPALRAARRYMKQRGEYYMRLSVVRFIGKAGDVLSENMV